MIINIRDTTNHSPTMPHQKETTKLDKKNKNNLVGAKSMLNDHLCSEILHPLTSSCPESPP